MTSPSLEAVAERRLHFQEHYESLARPFEWKFTKKDLTALLAKLDADTASARSAA